MAGPYVSGAFSVPASLFGGSLNNDAATNGITLPNNKSFPSLISSNMKLGTLAGQFNLLTGFVTGTATAATPIDIDLTAITGILGDAINVKKGVGVLVVNFSTTVGFDLLVGAAATNPWVAPFAASPTPGTVVLTVPAGALLADGVTIIPSYFLLTAGSLAGLGVAAGSKVLRLNPGANAVQYGYAIAGRDA